MTVIVAVKTGAAAVLVADSKLTTQAISGTNDDGSPRFVQQTYDYAVKLVHDVTHSTICAFSGYGAVGSQNAADYFSRKKIDLHVPAAHQEKIISSLLSEIELDWNIWCETYKFQTSSIPASTFLLAAAPSDGIAPRIWRVEIREGKSKFVEILRHPSVWFEGSADLSMGLLYGYSNSFTDALNQHLNHDSSAYDNACIKASADTCPLNQINFYTMPIQDAIDFAVFCAKVQIEMDRFLPGFGACGGPIDIMTLEMSPVPTIKSFPGKSLHHPG